MVSIEEFADYAGTSVAQLQVLGERLSAGSDIQTKVYATYNRGRREIVVPATSLDRATKNLHRSFMDELPYKPPSHVHGFVRGRSPYTNAMQHLNQSCILRVDLQEFFPSINAERVRLALQGQGFQSEAANLCARITTVDGRLPIGLSTSPYLSNLVFETTDNKLVEYCSSARLNFTRYVDDMTFSGNLTSRSLKDISELLKGEAWTVNSRKTVFMRRGGPQYVTGLYVGCADRPRIPRRIKRQMRRICFLINKVGYDSYMSDFGGVDARMVPNRLFGWARHIAAVEPNVGYPMLQVLSAHVPEDHPHSIEHPRTGLKYITDIEEQFPLSNPADE